MNDLGGRVAVVTGAGSGIGLAIAQALTAAGAHVVAFERDATTQGAFEAAAPGDFVALDVADPGAVDRAVDGLARVDVLVNCAGIRGVGDALDLPLTEWQRILDVDLTGAYSCARAAGRRMRAQRSGAIVNIASIAGVLGFGMRTPYTVAKHGVVGLTRALAAELGPAGIRVNAICPGLIETPLTRAYVTEPAMVDALCVHVPLGRAGAPEEIADVAVFLAGDASRYVTGVVLPVDGGFTAVGSFGLSAEASSFTNPISVVADDGP